MEFRRFLLRVMLWSLGIGAVLGATAVLSGGQTIVWRVSGTTLCTALAAALMMAASRLSEQKGGRSAGVLAMGLVTAAFFVAMLLIWAAPILRSQEEYLGLTLVWMFLCGLPAVAIVRVLHESSMRVAAPAALLTTSVAFVVLMIGTWGTSNWLIRNDCLSSAAAIGLIGLLAAGSLVNVGRTAPHVLTFLRGVGALMGGLAILVALEGIWRHISEGSALFRIPLSIAAVMTHVNLCLLVPLRSGQQWLRIVTIAAGVLTAACVNFVLSVHGTGDDPIGRIAGASGVVAACGSLALVVLARLNRRGADQVPVLSAIRELTLICPGCQRKQTLAVGSSSCPNCRLRFQVRIDEPRCPQCDYLLFMLASDRCPECGAIVGEEHGAAAAGTRPAQAPA